MVLDKSDFNMLVSNALNYGRSYYSTIDLEYILSGTDYGKDHDEELRKCNTEGPEYIRNLIDRNSSYFTAYARELLKESPPLFKEALEAAGIDSNSDTARKLLELSGLSHVYDARKFLERRFTFTGSCHSIFCMTIGTSIGGAMICNERLISGASNSAGEIAYMRVPGGMLHELASTTHLVKYYAQLRGCDVSEVNGIRIFNEAEAGDPVAQKAIDDLIEHLSDGITNVVSVQNPQAVVLGGGIMAREDYLRPRLENALESKLRKIVLDATRIEFAKLRNDAGMLGGFFHFKQRQGL